MRGFILRLFFVTMLAFSGIVFMRVAVAETTTTAEIDARAADPHLYSFEEFSALDKSSREMYAAALRELLADVAEREEKSGTQYETASLGGSGARFVFFDRWIAQGAVAKVDEKSCIYAGWMSQLDFNGRYCDPPKTEGCASGSVQCNPMLFGKGVCTPRGKRATSTCIRNAKPIEEIVRQMASQQAEWDAFKKDLDSYCERGRQGEICYIMKNRLRQMDQVARGGKSEAAPAPQAKTAAATKPAATKPTARNAQATRISGQQNAEKIAAQYPPRNASRTARQEGPDSEGNNYPRVTSTGRCDPLGLVGTLDPPSSLRTAGHQPLTLLSFREAQDLMCERSAINEAQLSQRRATSVRESERIKSLRAAEVRHHRQLIDLYRSNLDACMSEARRLRASNSPPQRGRSANLSLGPSPGSLWVTARDPRNGETKSSYAIPETLGQVMMVYRLNICDVSDQTGTGGVNGGGAGPGGAASSIFSSPASGSR